MPQDMIAILMFSTMLMLMMTGQRVFGVIGFVAVAAALALWGTGGESMAFSAGDEADEVVSAADAADVRLHGLCDERGRLADDLYRMFHVWFGPVPGGLAIGTILLMVLISAMNGLSVAGMAIGSPPSRCRSCCAAAMTRHGDRGDPGRVQPWHPDPALGRAGALCHDRPRTGVGQLWLAGVLPGLMMAGLFILYIVIRCGTRKSLGPPLSREERADHAGGKAVVC
jgi:TRAP-type mannitol/chloroaromatic compound transport system permease large subunit